MNPPPAEVDPLRHAGARLVILDVRNRVERRHLLDWLHGAWGALKSADWVALRLSDARTEPALDSLAARLGSATKGSEGAKEAPSFNNTAALHHEIVA